MKTIKSISSIFLFSLLIGATLSSCSKSNNGSVDEEDNASGEHTYNITLINKGDASNKVEYRGGLPLDEARAIYRYRTISDEIEHSITMLFGKLEEVGSIYGNFDLDDSKQPFTKLGGYSLQDGGTLTIRPEGTTDMYISTSGTLTFSDLKYALPTSAVGAACYTLKFEGDFDKYTDGDKTDETYQGSGTFVISPQDDMGTYKTP